VLSYAPTSGHDLLASLVSSLQGLAFATGCVYARGIFSSYLQPALQALS
jgi:hypothetical protein